jgi:hypothetical protein
MKTYEGVDVYIHVFLTSALAGEVSDQIHASAAGTHWIEVFMGPRAGLDDLERRKFLILPGLELRHLGLQPAISRYTDCAIPALKLSPYRKEFNVKVKFPMCPTIGRPTRK